MKFSKKRVFLRADLNVPLRNKTIVQDYRLKKILPTIDYIQKNGGKVVLATHIGRPDAKSQKNFFDENLSTKILASWFEKHNYKIDYEIDLLKAITKSNQNWDQILLLENLRFFNGEKEVSDNFANLLAKCADFYINDAFALSHRSDTSVSLLAKKFDEKNKEFGPLYKKEIEELTKIKENPKQPFVIILGGNKSETKLKVLSNFLEKPTKIRAQTILLGGALANSNEAKNLVEKAKNFDVKVLLPIDGTRGTAPHGGTASHECDIGPNTIEIFKKEISTAKTIFLNGTMGIYEKPGCQAGTQEILRAVAHSDAYSIIGGGDAVAATHLFGFDKKINFLSTGGGATLDFLSR
jgi:phosphoglycerate kinase